MFSHYFLSFSHIVFIFDYNSVIFVFENKNRKLDSNSFFLLSFPNFPYAPFHILR